MPFINGVFGKPISTNTWADKDCPINSTTYNRSRIYKLYRIYDCRNTNPYLLLSTVGRSIIRNNRTTYLKRLKPHKSKKVVYVTKTNAGKRRMSFCIQDLKQYRTFIFDIVGLHCCHFVGNYQNWV